MSLKNYLKKAYKEVFLTWEAVLSTVDQVDATLRADGENLILVYGGTFNPPHQGHVDVLLSGLRPEIGALAVVVLPCEDYLLRNKMVNKNSSFLLQMQRRVDIWNSIGSVPKDKAWIWTTTYFPFQCMVQAAIRLAQADGYKLAFSHMVGPDNLRLHDPLMILPNLFFRVLVTNRARHISTHFLPDNTPVRWKGFGEWSRCYDEKSGTTEEQVVFWTCQGNISAPASEMKGYYLQFLKPRLIDINSTDLRTLVSREFSGGEVELNMLSTTALLDILPSIV